MLRYLKDRFYFKINKPNLFGNKGLSLAVSFAISQNLKGITNTALDDDLKPTGKCYPFWDMEKCTLDQCCNALEKVQKKYDLSNIYILSDLVKSYRAYCWGQVVFRPCYLKILLDTEYLDPLFFTYTDKRGEATLRGNNKLGRQPQKIVAVLQSYFVPFPKHYKTVDYATDVSKKGVKIVLGNGGYVDA
jgi:hypothetical protein